MHSLAENHDSWSIEKLRLPFCSLCSSKTAKTYDMTEASRVLELRSPINSQPGVSFGELGRVDTSLIVLEDALVIAYPNLTIRDTELARQHAKFPRLATMGPKL